MGEDITWTSKNVREYYIWRYFIDTNEYKKALAGDEPENVCGGREYLMRKNGRPVRDQYGNTLSFTRIVYLNGWNESNSHIGFVRTCLHKIRAHTLVKTGSKKGG